MSDLLRKYVRESLEEVGGPITLTLQPNQIVALADVLGMHVENIETDVIPMMDDGEEYDLEQYEAVKEIRDRLEQWIARLVK